MTNSVVGLPNFLWLLRKNLQISDVYGGHNFSANFLLRQAKIWRIRIYGGS